MEELIMFEKAFYECESHENKPNDVEHLVNILINLPAIRPFSLEKSVQLCTEYCKNEDFRELFVQRAFICPVLLFKLYQNGSILFSEVSQHFQKENSLILKIFFRKDIVGFEYYNPEKRGQYGFDDSFIENDESIDTLISFGYLPNSIEYCLKYDDIDIFQVIYPCDASCAKWSPFEWSKKPKSLDFLSFSGFFGSIHCFKHLLLSGYIVKSCVFKHVYSSGNFELISLFGEYFIDYTELLFVAIEFNRFSFVVHSFENGANINARKDYNFLCFFRPPLYIWLLKRDISVLLTF